MTNSLNPTTRTARWIALVAAGAALVSVTAGAATAAERQPVPVPVPVSGAIGGQQPLDARALAELMAPGEVASGTMVRVGGPGVRWTGATGPLSQDPAANFRIGSITKVFTSTVVLQLVAEGRFSLDTPVQQLLPGTLPAHWQPITVAQLLSHTSGLPRICKDPVSPATPAPTPAQLVAMAAACGEAAHPVPQQQYNGVNYVLAGMVIEKVTGRPYADEVQRRIARPLGLRHTYLPKAGDTSIPSPSLAAPVAVEPWAWAEGGMISNAPDLERFLSALLRGRLLPPAQQRQLFTMPAMAGGAQDAFSTAGLMRHQLADGTVVWGKTGSMTPNTNGVFATADGRRVLVYSLTPATADGQMMRKYLEGIAEAAF